MCAERIQRFIMAAVLLLAGYLLTICSFWGLLLQGFVVLMIVVWAITDFCPSIWMLKKFTKPCYKV